MERREFLQGIVAGIIGSVASVQLANAQEINLIGSGLPVGLTPLPTEEEAEFVTKNYLDIDAFVFYNGAYKKIGSIESFEIYAPAIDITMAQDTHLRYMLGAPRRKFVVRG